jgi:LysR family hydrogen peroxide-inducible transcriptional activator
MNIRIFKFIIFVDEYKNFSKAAEKVNVSQPALSQQIAKYEDQLGCKIFERNNKKVITTEIGNEIIKNIKEIIEREKSIKEIAKYGIDAEIGSLKIAAFPTLAPFIFPKLVKHIKQIYPQLKLFLIEDKTEILIKKLLNGEIDIALLAKPVIDNSLEFMSLFNDKFLLAVNKNHNLAKKDDLKKSDINQYKLLLLDEGHCMRDQAIEFCGQIGAGQHNFRASTIETLRQMVISNSAITLIPEIALDNNPEIKYIKFTDINPEREIAVFWRKSFNKKNLIRNIFTKFLL